MRAHQVTSILLCALLASTLGHEYLAAKQLALDAKPRSGLGHFQERIAKQEQCDYICTDNNINNGSLKIIVNETTSLIGIVNITAEVALVIDINANLVGLFNGTSGAAIIINVKTGVGVYIAPGQCGRVWINSKRTFEVFFKNLTSLQALSNHVGTKFTVGSASNAILEVIANLLVKLSGSSEQEVEGDVKSSIKILLRITTIIISSYRGSLKGFLKFFGSDLNVLYGDIFWLVNVFEGLVLFFSKINGGLAALIKAGVELNLALLLKTSNGVELLANLLLRIVARVDLSIASGAINSDEVLIELFVKLGGNVSSGVTGVWKIIYEILLVRSGSIKLEVLIRTLIEYSIETKSPIPRGYIDGLSDVIKIQESRYSSTNIKGFTDFVKNFKNETLVVKGINVSAIIAVLTRGAASGVLVLVITVLLRLTSIVPATESILGLLLVLLRLLTSVSGVRLLSQVISGLSINTTGGGGFNLIRQIFAGINILTIVRWITTGLDLNAVLTGVPVLGQIYKAVSGAVSSASKGSLSLKVIIKTGGSSSFVVEIKSWFKEIFNIYQHKGPKGTVSVDTVTETSKYNYTYYEEVTFKIGK